MARRIRRLRRLRRQEDVGQDSRQGQDANCFSCSRHCFLIVLNRCNLRNLRIAFADCCNSACLESMLAPVSSKTCRTPLTGSDDTSTKHSSGVQIPLLERSIAMTSFRSGVSSTTSQKRASVRRWSLVIILCLGTFAGMSPVTLAGNRCKDRCKDVYDLEKRACKAIPLKHERHSCEDAAKRAKNNCKHRCR